MTVTVKQLRLVTFPAGHLRQYMGQSDKHVDWGWHYIMQVAAGRGGVFFTDGDAAEGTYGDITGRFNKAALRRCFVTMVHAAPPKTIETMEEWQLDERTQIRWRRFRESATYEIAMPCGTEGCLKKRTVERLIKELA